MIDRLAQAVRREGARLGYYRDQLSKLPRWIVYGAYDVRDFRNPFYIGVTKDLWARARAHYSDVDMPVREYVRRIEATGSHCVLRSLGQFYSRPAASLYERFLIALTPGLLNRLDASNELAVVPIEQWLETEERIEPKKGPRPVELPPEPAWATARSYANVLSVLPPQTAHEPTRIALGDEEYP